MSIKVGRIEKDPFGYVAAAPVTDEEIVYGTSESVKLFDVVCVVGSVYSGGTAPDPRRVALHMIAEHGVDGEYSFPDKDLGMVRVSIQTDGKV